MIQKTANNLLFVLLIVVVVFVSGDVLGVWDLPLEVRDFSERITNTLSTTLGDTRDDASGFLARLCQNTSSFTHA